MTQNQNWPAWAEAFLEALKDYPGPSGRVSPGKAAALAGIGRIAAYKLRWRNQDFAAKWDKIALLCLEAERQRRLRSVRRARDAD